MADKPALPRTAVVLGALSAAFSVAAGAFGAHGLKDILPAESLGIYEVAVRYHLYHSVALILVGFAAVHASPELRPTFSFPVWFFVFGILFFSGSLYLFSLSGLAWPVVVTPIGGGCFIAGWIAFARAAMRSL